MASSESVGAKGFAFLSLLILLAIIGIATSATVTLGVLVERRAAEQALLEVGAEFQQALASYIGNTPVGKPTYPNTLEDLLRDPRTPVLRRHLRKVYADPITGKMDWVLMPAPGGQGFAGLHSVSTARPIKRANFDSMFVGFDDRNSYSEWEFAHALTAGGVINFSN